MNEHIPLDYGVPVNGIQFGLYFYPKDRFLFVSDNEKIVEVIQTLLRSKLSLSKIPVHKLKNWNPEIIDNTVCSCWGIGFDNSAPVLVDHLMIDESLQEVEFFANMIYWIEISLNSLTLSKSYVTGINDNSQFDNALALFDDPVLNYIIEADTQRLVDFDSNIKRMRKELHKICYWARTKAELVEQLSEFVSSKNTYNQLFHKEVLNWWKLS